MSGYSATPLPRKLGFRAGQRVSYVNPPANFGELLVDTKVCAIDETWSGLRLVIRKELR